MKIRSRTIYRTLENLREMAYDQYEEADDAPSLPQRLTITRNADTTWRLKRKLEDATANNDYQKVYRYIGKAKALLRN